MTLVVIEVIINVSKDPPPRLTLYALRAYDIRRLMNHSRLLLLSSGPHRFVRSSSTQRIGYLQSDVGLASLCTVIGQKKKKRRQPIKQSDEKLKPVLTSSLSFSRALRSLLFAFLSSHWLL